MRRNDRNRSGFESLPKNYRELFFDTLKQNWRTFFLVGLISLLFFLPTLVFMFLNDYYFLSISSNESYTLAEVDALRITSANYFNIGASVGIVIACIGISGLSRVNLFLSREEGVFFFQDFNKGVKQNTKNNIVFFIIYAILIYFSFFVTNNIAGNMFLLFMPFALVQTIFFPLLLINVETTSIYSWLIKDSFRNAFIIYIKNFVFVLIFSTLFTSILLLNLIQHIVIKYISFVLFIVIIYPLLAISFRVFMNRALDRDINKKNYPEIYKKGIYTEESK
ncbi:MAG: hypothetical protein IJ247_04915 [Bacilli bacterium]|nr:hypothetical protein [Bacilli bacterium]